VRRAHNPQTCYLPQDQSQPPSEPIGTSRVGRPPIRWQALASDGLQQISSCFCPAPRPSKAFHTHARHSGGFETGLNSDNTGIIRKGLRLFLHIRHALAQRGPASLLHGFSSMAGLAFHFQPRARLLKSPFHSHRCCRRPQPGSTSICVAPAQALMLAQGRQLQSPLSLTAAGQTLQKTSPARRRPRISSSSEAICIALLLNSCAVSANLLKCRAVLPFFQPLLPALCSFSACPAPVPPAQELV